jgi:predicted DNA-binding antitoxin AbrB/MazE fold protein
VRRYPKQFSFVDSGQRGIIVTRVVNSYGGVRIMAINVEAVYENGVLKPAQPLPLKEHEKVRLTVQAATSRVRQTAGLMGWTGSQEDADFVALSPELDPQENA